MPDWQKTPKQKLASKLIADNSKTRVLLFGGSRSGKTFMLVYAVLVRALKHEGSRHLITRLHFSHAKAALCFDTIPKVMDVCFPGLREKTHLNKQDWFYKLPNGSEIWIGGLDDGDRIDKILGREYVTIYFNEASEISYVAIKVASTRLAQKVEGCTNKAFFDCNPPNKRHWLYYTFVLGLDFEQKTPLHKPERYAILQMNPEDNVANVADGYIDETLQGLHGKERLRFLQGEFTDDAEGALWKSAWISDNRVWRPYRRQDYSEIIVAVDPAISALTTSDATGIVVVGKDVKLPDTAVILADMTVEQASPAVWAEKVISAFHEFDANWVVGESNQGGDLVEMNIRHRDSSVPFAPVRATKGKALRAEPVAQLSERGHLLFAGEFPQLEDELTTWSPLSGQKSPNRLDAMVYGVVRVMRWGKRAGVW